MKWRGRRRWRPRRRKGPRSVSVKAVADVLGKWLDRQEMTKRMWPHALRLHWPTLVGPRIAAQTRPASVRDGQLTIEVSSSAWLNELSFLKRPMLQRIEREGRRLRGEGVPLPPKVAGLRLLLGPRGFKRVAPARAAAPPLRRTVGPGPGEEQKPLPPVEDPELGAAIDRARRAWARCGRAQRER